MLSIPRTSVLLHFDPAVVVKVHLALCCVVDSVAACSVVRSEAVLGIEDQHQSRLSATGLSSSRALILTPLCHSTSASPPYAVLMMPHSSRRSQSRCHSYRRVSGHLSWTGVAHKPPSWRTATRSDRSRTTWREHSEPSLTFPPRLAL